MTTKRVTFAVPMDSSGGQKLQRFGTPTTANARPPNSPRFIHASHFPVANSMIPGRKLPSTPRKTTLVAAVKRFTEFTPQSVASPKPSTNGNTAPGSSTVPLIPTANTPASIPKENLLAPIHRDQLKNGAGNTGASLSYAERAFPSALLYRPMPTGGRQENHFPPPLKIHQSQSTNNLLRSTTTRNINQSAGEPFGPSSSFSTPLPTFHPPLPSGLSPLPLYQAISRPNTYSPLYLSPFNLIATSVPIIGMDTKTPEPYDEDALLKSLGIEFGAAVITTPSAIPAYFEHHGSFFNGDTVGKDPVKTENRQVFAENEKTQSDVPTRHIFIDVTGHNAQLPILHQLLKNFKGIKCVYLERVPIDGIGIITFYDVRDAMSALQKTLNDLGWHSYYYKPTLLEKVANKEYFRLANAYEADLICKVKPKIGVSTTDAMVYRAVSTFGPVWNITRNELDGFQYNIKFYDVRHAETVLGRKTALIDGMVLEFKLPKPENIEKGSKSPPLDAAKAMERYSLATALTFINRQTSAVKPGDGRQVFGSPGGVAPPFTPLHHKSSFMSDNESPTKNAIDLSRVALGHDTRTTVMLRNIPNKVDQAALKEFLDETSFGLYNFLYLRIDFKNLCNVGYAFINFVDPLDIVTFVKARSGQKWGKFNSEKVLDITYANIQGLECLIEKFRNSNVMDQADAFRPKLFHTSGPARGTEQEFPPANNLNRKLRSINAAQHIGLFSPKGGSTNSSPLGRSPWKK